jgi:phage-related baseplate assembly protein
MIDLSLLAAPNVIESLDYESILAERKAYFVSLYPADEQANITATLSLESEPIVKLLQETSYRELLLRSRINNAALATMLAFATGADLDQRGASVDVERLIITEADDTAIPPVDAVYETDDDYRYRIQLSFDAYTTAGSKESYIFHGRSAYGDVKDINPISPMPGVVTVYVLSRTGDGTASEELIAKVDAALNQEKIRPMTDQVTVQSAAILNYTVDAELVLFQGPDQTVVKTAALNALAEYTDAQRKIGYDITLDGIYKALRQTGVQKVNLTNPTDHITIGDGQAGYCTAMNITIAGAANG